MKTISLVGLVLSVAVVVAISTSPCLAATRYVDGGIDSSGAGTSWATAKKTVQEAVAAAAQFDQIWVKAGTYPLSSTIALNKPMYLYGGFAGTETALSQRNLKLNVTTLDGQNARQCVSITSDNVIFDGFTVTKGYATGATQSTYGSGIYINPYSSGNGGGTYVTVTNCKLSFNTNVSALYMYAFTGTISNCIIYQNSALYDGAGIMVHQSQATIINCTVVYNRATNGTGGGIYVLGSNYTPGQKIINSIVWNNTAPTGANLYASNSGTLSVSYSNIQGGYTGIGNKNIAPGFVSAGTYNYHLAPGASCCVDQGSNSYLSTYNVLTDFEGDPRISGTYVDIGADEYFVANSPTVTTTAISAVTTTAAASGGSVTSDGGAAVTERGVCWSRTASPTVNDSHTSDGSGTGNFASSLSGLDPATTYHVRAYATNSVGTAYGSEVDFSTYASLSTLVQGSGTGTVLISPPDTTCRSGICSTSYPFGTHVNLSYQTALNTFFAGWSGDCISSAADCNLTMDSVKAVLAAFSIDPDYAVWLDPGSLYYSSIGDAYESAGDGLVIRACRLVFTENLDFDDVKSISFSGGYISDYSRVEGITGIAGLVTFRRGSVAVNNILVK